MSTDDTAAAASLSARTTARAGRRPFALFGSELATMFRRWRTIVMLVALALVPVLIAIAVRLTGAGSRGRGPAFLGDITGNGLFVIFTAITVSIPLFLPLTVGVVAGDSIAGEANLGTLRYLLIAPVGRVRLLAVKFVSSCVFVAAALLSIVIGGVAAGAALFPMGPVTLLSGDTVSVGDAFGRVMLLAGYASISLLGLCAIGLFISTLTSMPVGAMAATVVIAGVSQVLDQLPQFDAIHAYLPTHYWLGFADLLRSPIVFDSYGQNIVLQLGYIIVFGGFAITRFTTKDILS
ncbi:ABC transporter permease [Microbacterium mangrovi]|nr:ABC transporter permease subunit [Microbacterium mangrovi]